MRKSKVKIEVKPRGVFFSIDHQTFHIATGYEDDTPMMKKKMYPWYARQLKIAFKRLKQSYGTGRQVRR